MDNFLKSLTTYKQCGQEFTDWHKGISHYGFWAVEIHDPNWLSVIKSAQSYLQQYSYPNYLRAPHITISACGLIDEHHFSTVQLNQQVEALQKLSISPFKLTLGPLDSFTSAMYLGIEDHNDSLYKIREHLNAITADHPTEIFYPHITLGLYRENFKTSEVAKTIQNFRLKAPQNLTAIDVKELVFCRYETKVLQGPFKIERRIKLI